MLQEEVRDPVSVVESFPSSLKMEVGLRRQQCCAGWSTQEESRSRFRDLRWRQREICCMRRSGKGCVVLERRNAKTRQF
eukprot:scaffold143_cov173-Ochromonas_danica.AAC.10